MAVWNRGAHSQFLLCEEAEDINFESEATEERKVFPSAQHCQAPYQHPHKRGHSRMQMECSALYAIWSRLCDITLHLLGPVVEDLDGKHVEDKTTIVAIKKSVLEADCNFYKRRMLAWRRYGKRKYLEA